MSGKGVVCLGFYKGVAGQFVTNIPLNTGGYLLNYSFYLILLKCTPDLISNDQGPVLSRPPFKWVFSGGPVNLGPQALNSEPLEQRPTFLCGRHASIKLLPLVETPFLRG